MFTQSVAVFKKIERNVGSCMRYLFSCAIPYSVMEMILSLFVLYL